MNSQKACLPSADYLTGYPIRSPHLPAAGLPGVRMAAPSLSLVSFRINSLLRRNTSGAASGRELYLNVLSGHCFADLDVKHTPVKWMSLQVGRGVLLKCDDPYHVRAASIKADLHQLSALLDGHIVVSIYVRFGCNLKFHFRFSSHQTGPHLPVTIAGEHRSHPARFRVYFTPIRRAVGLRLHCTPCSALPAVNGGGWFCRRRGVSPRRMVFS